MQKNSIYQLEITLFQADPPALDNKNRPNFFGALMYEYVENAEWYKTYLSTSYERILREGRGEDLPLISNVREPDLKIF